MTLLFPAPTPYAIGSTDGSAWNATFVFNGWDRIAGAATQPRRPPARAASRPANNSEVARSAVPIGAPVAAAPVRPQRPARRACGSASCCSPRSCSACPRCCGRSIAPARPGRDDRARVRRLAAAAGSRSGSSSTARWRACTRATPRASPRRSPQPPGSASPGRCATGSGSASATVAGALAPRALRPLPARRLEHDLAPDRRSARSSPRRPPRSAGERVRAAAARRRPRRSPTLALPLAGRPQPDRQPRVRQRAHRRDGAERGRRRSAPTSRARRRGARYEFAAADPTEVGALIVHDRRPILSLTSYGAARAAPDPAARARSSPSGQLRFAVIDGGCGRARRATSRRPARPGAAWVRAHGIDVSLRAGLPARARAVPRCGTR